ncbi:MAG: hypothetical protein WA159_17265 [Variovorax sp.]
MQTLFRAFVSLPAELCQRDRPLQERTVFFEAEYDYAQQSNTGAARALEQLLALAWGVDTTGWCEDGLIYNIWRDRELLDNAYGDDSDGDKRLLEIGCGPEGICYAKAADVDLFVTPRNHARLDAALNATAALTGDQHQPAGAAAPRCAARTTTNPDYPPSTAWPRAHVPKKAKALPRQRQSLL